MKKIQAKKKRDCLGRNKIMAVSTMNILIICITIVALAVIGKKKGE